MEKYKEIIEILQKQKTIAPPEYLTDHLMKRLPDQYPGILFAVASFAHNLYKHALEPDGDTANSITHRECSFYFFITGLFYLIIGIILMMRLQWVNAGIVAIEWIKLQPHLTIGTAIWLLALGLVLMLNGRSGIKAAKYGTIFYFLFALANGILMWSYIHSLIGSMFIIGFVGTSVLMGFMLAHAVKKVELRHV